MFQKKQRNVIAHFLYFFYFVKFVFVNDIFLSQFLFNIMRQFIFLLFTLTSFINSDTCSQVNVDKAVKHFLRKDGMSNATLGLSVIKVETGEEIYSYNGNLCLKPASTLKAITTSTALGVLGEDFKFETKLHYDGKIENGVLKGDLIIKGGGDPSLGFMRYEISVKHAQMQNIWVKAIKEAGISKIDGNIIGDASIFDSNLIPPKFTWDDMGNYYAAGACGLNIHENQYNIQFKPGVNVGDQTQIELVYPYMPESIEFVNEVKTGTKGSGDQAIVYCAPFSEKIFVRGTVPAGSKSFTIKGSVPDPAEFVAAGLKKVLQDKGIEVAGYPISTYQKQDETLWKTIHTWYSPALKDMVYWANKKSINIYCEAFLKMMAYKKYNIGSTVRGLDVVKSYWKSRGVNMNAYFIFDGCGLSPDNSISTNNIAKILQKAYSEDYFESFDKSLSYAGVPDDRGSLRSQLSGTKAAGNLRAKSGYISRVRSYSGYVTNECGELLSFSIIVNNYTCSNSQARTSLMAILKTLAEMQ